MHRIALYARVSTDEQTAAPQLDALREYAARRGWEPSEYVDEGVSGARASRPALDRLQADARRRSFDAVACVKLDRLARSVRAPPLSVPPPVMLPPTRVVLAGMVSVMTRLVASPGPVLP